MSDLAQVIEYSRLSDRTKSNVIKTLAQNPEWRKLPSERLRKILYNVETGTDDPDVYIKTVNRIVGLQK